MREYLFRGKCLDDGEWVYGYYVKQLNANEIYCLDDCEFERRHVDPSTVGQYTGLKDKVGNKIFEGDIVKYNGTIHEAIFEERNLTAYFGIVFGQNETWEFCASVPSNQMEVIGNRWDNPELLEVRHED